ncbi:MAG: ATP synthase subunit I [bacterium]
MTDTSALAWALGTGVVLGAAFFGGLWWTVRMGTSCRRPALLFLSSFFLRMSLALAGFYFVADGRWDRLLTCLFGFVIARLVVTELTGARAVPRTTTVKESGHASRS